MVPLSRALSSSCQPGGTEEENAPFIPFYKTGKLIFVNDLAKINQVSNKAKAQDPDLLAYSLELIPQIQCLNNYLSPELEPNFVLDFKT